MPAAAAARAVGVVPSGAGGSPAGAAVRGVGPEPRFDLSLAREADDADICRLLAAAAFPGDVQVSLERAPSPSRAGAIDGDVHEIIIARDRATAALAGVASRSVRDAYLNGCAARVGYLGQLRLDCGRGLWRGLLAAGFACCRDRHDQGDASFYLTSVVADNAPARRLLERRLVAGAPTFLPVGRLRTFAIPTPLLRSRAAAVRALDIRLEQGSQAHLAAIVACLQRNLRRYQFAPRWTLEDFRSARTRGLAPEHFTIALHRDRVIGCLARWDQTAFKQVVIRGYSPRLARWRPVVNAVGGWVGLSRLPPVGATLRCAYLSHAAVDDDRADVFAALVSEQRRRARLDGADFVVAGFPAEHPFHAVLARRFRSRTYDSVIYLAAWEDAERCRDELDGRVLQPEVAVL